MSEFYAVGHITEDQPPHIGGAVSYAAVTIERLGGEASVITRAPVGHPYISELQTLGVEVYNLPIHDSDHAQDITSFLNTYDKRGNRTQFVSRQQETIGATDMQHFPKMPPGSVVFVAPVIGEVDPEIFGELAQNRLLVVAPQGYFREADKTGAIHQRPWPAVDGLRHAEIVVLSEEDLTFRGEFDQNTLDRIRAHCGKVVLTRGTEGLSVYQSQQKPIDVAAFKLTEDEIISPTGAGDSCAAALTWHFSKHKNLRQAAVFGALYPALKIMGLGGERGITALPTLSQIQQYIVDNADRYSEFLATNALEELEL